MKKFTIAATMLAVTFFSGDAFAVAVATKALQVPNDAVKVSYCRHRHVRFVPPGTSFCTCGWSWYGNWPDCACGYY
jgi:hypothetical protein